MGLESLRAGQHVLRAYPQHGEPTGALEVGYVWKVEVLPSFHKPLVLCAAEVESV